MSQDDTHAAGKYPDWLNTVGWTVHGLLRQSGVMKRFRAMLATWMDEHKRQQAEQDDWKRRRHEYFARAVAGDPRLQDKSAEPPGEDWQYVGHVVHEDDEASAEGTRRPRVIGVWCPPDLTAEAEPPVHSPWSFCHRDDPFDPEAASRPLTVPEKYVVLAMIHDTVCAGQEAINPWAGATTDDVPAIRLAITYEAVRRGVEELRDGDRGAVEAFLEDVTTDLRTHRVSATSSTPLPPVLAEADQTATPPTEPQYVFRLCGNMWEVRFGEEEGHFEDIKGFGIIHKLLQQPNPQKPIRAIDLVGGSGSTSAARHASSAEFEGAADNGGGQTSQEILDDEAVRQFEDRLKEIPQEIEEANRREDAVKTEELEREKEFILGELKTKLNLRGDARALGPASSEEKARKAVANNVARAYREMRQAKPPLASLEKHLRNSIRTEGTAYSYRPSPSPEWALE